MRTATISEAMQTSEMLQTIYERRSVRKYRNLPVDTAIIEKIIDAGRMAPTAYNKQSWKFYVLTNSEIIRLFSKQITKLVARGVLRSGPKKIIKTLSAMLRFSHGFDYFKGGDPVFFGAPVVIFITSPRNNEWAALEAGMCAQNMMLAAKALGLDSCPVGSGKFVEHIKSFPMLQVSPDEKVHLSVILGYGAETPEATERKKDNVFYIEEAEVL